MTKSHQQFEQKLNQISAKKSAKNKTTEGKIKSSMQIFRRRAQGTVRKKISKTIKRQLNLQKLDLRHKSQVKGDIQIIEEVESVVNDNDDGGAGEVNGEGEKEEIEDTRWGKLYVRTLSKKYYLFWMSTKPCCIMSLGRSDRVLPVVNTLR